MRHARYVLGGFACAGNLCLAGVLLCSALALAGCGSLTTPGSLQPATAPPSAPPEASQPSPLPEGAEGAEGASVAQGLLSPLDEAAGQVYGRRARVARPGPVQVIANGPWVEPNNPEVDPNHREVIVVGESPLRVVDSTNDVRFMVYVQRESLLKVNTAPVALSRTSETGLPAAPVTPPPIEIAGGLVMRLGARSGSTREVHVDVDHVEVSGWLDESVLGEVYDAKRFALPPDQEPCVEIEERTIMRDAPAGAELAGIRDGYGVTLEVTGAEMSGFTPIAVSGPNVRLRGWVLSERLSTRCGASMQGTSGGGWGSSGATVTLPAGVELHSRPAGDVFARTIDEALFYDYGPAPMGWLHVAFPTDWGNLEAWVPPGVAPLSRQGHR